MSSEDIRSIGRQLRQIEDPRTRSLFERILQNMDTVKSSLAELENPPRLEWIDLNLQNNWVRYGDVNYPAPQFTKTKENIVLLRGLISTGTTTPGTIIFNFPAGYRPGPNSIYLKTVHLSTGLGRVDVFPNGDLAAVNVSATWTALDNIMFLAFQ